MLVVEPFPVLVSSAPAFDSQTVSLIQIRAIVPRRLFCFGQGVLVIGGGGLFERGTCEHRHEGSGRVQKEVVLYVSV
jgi:hypothetical protein